jgi:opacity protein-like surface antigen
MRLLLKITLLLSSLAGSAFANDFTIQTGYAPSNATGLGSFHVYTSDRRFFQTLAGYSWKLHEWKNASLSYHVDVIPLCVISDPAERVQSQFVSDTHTTTASGLYRTDYPIKPFQSEVHVPAGTNTLALQVTTIVSTTRITTYGGGANPVGFELHVRPRRRIQPFAFGSGGFLLFTHEEPVNRSSAFNFSFAIGGGVDIQTHEKRALTLGYKLVHFSNANLGSRNPGVNANFLYVGYRFGR